MDIPVIHADQHGAAIILLAGMINVLDQTGKDKSSVKVVLNIAEGSKAYFSTINLLTRYGFP